jgi:DNA-binding GntR family transcriptional regulator
MTEHEAFIAALRARDGKRLGRLMREHLANTWPRIKAAVGALERGV